MNNHQVVSMLIEAQLADAKHVMNKLGALLADIAANETEPTLALLDCYSVEQAMASITQEVHDITSTVAELRNRRDLQLAERD